MKLLRSLSCTWAFWSSAAYAFAPSPSVVSWSSRTTTSISALASSRRDFMESVLQTTMCTASVFFLSPVQEAVASGGATAGGAYLLSAKQRYNERVQQGVKGYVGLQAALEGGNIDALRTFFSNEDVGGWKDFSAAGYLLANAFRRNSTAAPDSLPSVKAWKKFAASVEGITKALKKKDTKGALTVYNDSLILLDEYLKQVELPIAKEI